ncbi:hypothetical protein CR513_34266, partial [Mucuna pruriens]
MTLTNSNEVFDNRDKYSSITVDVVGKFSISPLIIVKYLKKFIIIVNEIFGVKYSRRSNNNDIKRLLQMRETCDFLSMLCSFDYMH